MLSNITKKSAVVALMACMLTTSIATPAMADRDDWHDRRGWEDDWGRGRGHHDDDNWRHGRGHDRHWDDRRYYRPYRSSNVIIYNPPVYRERVVTYNTVPVRSTYTTSYTTCSNSYNPLPMILGGAGGAAIGTQIGKGRGRDAAIISGALIGGMLGGQYGSGVQNCAQQVFDDAPIGTQVAWNGPQNSNYIVTPTKEYNNDGRYCREYQSTATVGGRRSQTYGTACMQPDGSWEIID